VASDYINLSILKNFITYYIIKSFILPLICSRYSSQILEQNFYLA